MTGLPPAAIDAGAIALAESTGRPWMADRARYTTRAILEAAAPLIAAAERDRIRQLLETEAPRYALGHTALRHIADLLTDPEGTPT